MPPNVELNKKVKVYQFFGINLENKTNTELVATCPFCGKDDHFFVNKLEAVFNCKRCGREGDYTDFLTQYYQELKEFDEPEKLQALADHRRLPIEAFDGYDILCMGDKYWYPIYNSRNKIQDIRHYQLGKHMYSIEGVEMGIFNLRALMDHDRKKEPVYVCEAEHDAIAANYLFKITKRIGLAVGVPGANTLKRDWYDYFNGRHLIHGMDNDNAGERGYDRIKTKVNGYASLKKIYWPDETPRGYDLNDFVSTYGVREGKYELCYDMLHALVKDENQEQNRITHKEQCLPPAENIELSQVIQEYKRTLEINKEFENAIKCALATILSNYIPGEIPLWIYFVGPPSCGKTAILNSAKHSELCHYESSLGKHQLISGWKMLSGSDPSIFSKIDNKCFILKDFTEVLFKSASDRDEIFSVLRGGFDGFVDRTFGNGVVRKYKVRFSMLAGVTQEINNFPQASAGERFLRYNFNHNVLNIDRQQGMAFEHSIFGDETREELKAYVSKFLKKQWDFTVPRIKEYIEHDNRRFYKLLKPLAQLIGYLRTPVIRFERGRKSDLPVYEPIPEVGNRSGIQLQRLAISLAILENKPYIDDEIYKIVKKVAFDTVESYGTRIVQILHKHGDALTKVNIIRQLGFPLDVRPYLEDLQLLKIVDAKQIEALGSKHPIYGYHLTSELFDLFSRVESEM